MFNKLLTIGLLCLLSVTANAEQKRVFGDLEVHYAIFESSFLDPIVASRYQIERSKVAHVINISLLKQQKGSDIATPVKGKVSVKMNDLMKVYPIVLREITENKAIYYIGQFDIDFEQPLTFTISAQETGSKVAHSFEFQTRLYPDKDE